MDVRYLFMGPAIRDICLSPSPCDPNANVLQNAAAFPALPPFPAWLRRRIQKTPAPTTQYPPTNVPSGTQVSSSTYVRNGRKGVTDVR